LGVTSFFGFDSLSDGLRSVTGLSSTGLFVVAGESDLLETKALLDLAIWHRTPS
jgi:hypothetical protein